MDNGKKAIVIGASSGIGQEIAFELARKGWQVAVAGRRLDQLQKAAARFPELLVPLAMDLDRTDCTGPGLDEATALLQGLDLLVISAGCGFINPELAVDQELQTIATNVAGFTAAADWGYTYFSRQGHGQLAAITSVGGLLGEGSAPAYPASKAYQILYLDSLARRAKKEKSGCRITELRPGSVNTAMMKGKGHFWISQPEEAAKVACKAILNKKRLQYISPRWALIGLLARSLFLLK